MQRYAWNTETQSSQSSDSEGGKDRTCGASPRQSGLRCPHIVYGQWLLIIEFCNLRAEGDLSNNLAQTLCCLLFKQKLPLEPKYKSIKKTGLLWGWEAKNNNFFIKLETVFKASWKTTFLFIFTSEAKATLITKDKIPPSEHILHLISEEPLDFKGMCTWKHESKKQDT